MALCHSLISPPREDAVTFLLGKIGRRNRVYSSVFPVPLGIVPENLHRRRKIRSLCTIFVKLVSPCSSGISIRIPICSRISATFYSFSFISCQGEIWFYFPVQNWDWGVILIRFLWILIVFTYTWRKVAEGLRLSTRITGIAFKKCVWLALSLLSPTDLTPLQPL